jgi:hypothetical protein
MQIGQICISMLLKPQLQGDVVSGTTLVSPESSVVAWRNASSVRTLMVDCEESVLNSGLPLAANIL